MAITGHFYHKSIRKYIIAFGTLFNGITIERTTNGVTTAIDVPIAYGSKNHWYARMQSNPNLDKPQAVTLPRMGFIITNIMYDAERKTSSIGKIAKVNPTDNRMASKVFDPITYNIDLALSIFAKNMDDALQIIEQILPFFKPSFNITINELDEMNIIRDIPITLNDTALIHDSEGMMDEYRVINFDLNFTVKGHFYGPLRQQPLIRKVVIDFHTDGAMEEPENMPVTERMSVEPEPDTAFASDDYGFATYIENNPEGDPVP